MDRSLLDLAWAAGVYEGEGSAWLQRTKSALSSKNVPLMKVSMNDEDVVRRFHAVMGFGTVYSELLKSGSTSFTWRSGDRAFVPGMLLTLYSFLGVRRRAKVEEVLRGFKPYGYEARSRSRHHVQMSFSPVINGPVVGEQHRLAKLTEKQVAEIRTLYAAGGVSQQALASRFGVCQTSISRLILRQDWKHVA